MSWRRIRQVRLVRLPEWEDGRPFWRSQLARVYGEPVWATRLIGRWYAIEPLFSD